MMKVLLTIEVPDKYCSYGLEICPYYMMHGGCAVKFMPVFDIDDTGDARYWRPAECLALEQVPEDVK
jgi:hypothetical protein